MNILCSICSDIFVTSEDASYTPCGHVFHFHCVTQWLVRAQTCPECREEVTQSQIHRIYFNIANNSVHNNSVREDNTLLKHRIDELSFQIILKEKEKEQYISKNKTLEHQTSCLRNEMKKLELEVCQKESAIYALKEQVNFFKQRSTEIDSLKSEVACLKRKLKDLQNIQIIIDNSIDDVDEMIANTTDPATLITYISVMKREMTTNVNRRRELRTTVKKLQQEVANISTERNNLLEMRTRKKQLEEDLAASKTENMALQTKLKELESTLLFMKNSNGTSLENTKSTIPDTKPKSNDASIISINDELNSDGSIIISSSESPIITKNKENSPNRRLKLRKGTTFKTVHDYSLASDLSILSKRPRLTRWDNVKKVQRIPTEVTYDGFGGHSKSDVFPDPIKSLKVKKQNDDVTKVKRQKLSRNNKKIGDFVII